MITKLLELANHGVPVWLIVILYAINELVQRYGINVEVVSKILQ